jgi:hypothetical protein
MKQSPISRRPYTGIASAHRTRACHFKTPIHRHCQCSPYQGLPLQDAHPQALPVLTVPGPATSRRPYTGTASAHRTRACHMHRSTSDRKLQNQWVHPRVHEQLEAVQICSGREERLRRTWAGGQPVSLCRCRDHFVNHDQIIVLDTCNFVVVRRPLCREDGSGSRQKSQSAIQVNCIYNFTRTYTLHIIRRMSSL